MPISVPAKAANAFDGSMKTSQTVELPFTCPAYYVVNGDVKLQAFNDFRYFGGWSCNTEKVKEVTEKWEGAPFPIPGFEHLNMVDDNGKPYETLSARSLIVAPIGMRMFSTLKENGVKRRVAPFTKGASPGVQVLCLQAYRNAEKQIAPLYPIMLTAHGYQVDHVVKAFSAWHKAIKPHVAKLVPGASASVLNLFYLYIGTFGPTRNAVPAGEKSITPISAFIPEDLDEKKVENLYVGSEIAEWMTEIREEADEWLKVFANMQQASARNNQPPVEEYVTDEPPPPEDDIPF